MWQTIVYVRILTSGSREGKPSSNRYHVELSVNVARAFYVKSISLSTTADEDWNSRLVTSNKNTTTTTTTTTTGWLDRSRNAHCSTSTSARSFLVFVAKWFRFIASLWLSRLRLVRVKVKFLQRVERKKAFGGKLMWNSHARVICMEIFSSAFSTSSALTKVFNSFSPIYEREFFKLSGEKRI